MYMKTFKKIGTSLICALFATPMMAQQTYEEMEQLTVNEQVTTVITASEPIRFVDSKLFHLFIRLLCHQRHCKQSTDK